jgi:hypothetical protein
VRLVVLLALSVLLFSREAAARIPLCFEAVAPPQEIEGFRKLVRSELDKHRSHQVVEADCRARLRVELFTAAGSRFLTAQMDRDVPVRYDIKDATELGPRLEDAIRLALHNDPTYLAEDVTHLNALQRFGRSILVRGRFTFRVELFETISRDEEGPATLPGIGLTLARGSGHWQVFARTYAAASFQQPEGTSAALQTMAGLDVGITYEFIEKGFWSPYASVAGGVQMMRFVGRNHPNAPSLADVIDAGAAASMRGGVRFFRWHNFDLDLFAQGYLPISAAKDIDGVLLPPKGIYAPSLQIGVGVGF